MSPRASNDVLGHIISSARAFANRHSSLSSTDIYNYSSSHLELPLRDWIFPQPQPLRLDSEIGLDRTISEQLSSAYLRAATRLKAYYEEKFRQTCRGLIQFDSPLLPDTTRLQSSLHSIYLSDYTERLDSWVEQVKIYGVRILCAKQKQGAVNMNKSSRRSFNQHVISILERFFEHNAFPSRLDKANLATEANLKYSQVHIWFQNRRRRFRKEGRELRKGDPRVVLPSELATSMIQLLASTEQNECSNKESISQEPNRTAAANEFVLTAPPHVFPSSYPPTCAYDPFPIEDGVHKFITLWIRKPSPTRTCRAPDIDLTQLTALFTKLTLDEPRTAASHIPSQPDSASHNRLSGAIGFMTIASPAPHPAFIPITGTSLSMSLARSAAQPCGPETGRRNARCLQSTASVTEGISRRKIASLPKRIPTSTSISHKGLSSCVSVISSASASTSRLSLASRTTSSMPVLSAAPDPYTRTISNTFPTSAMLSSSRGRATVTPKRTSIPSAAHCNPSSSLPRFVSTPSRTPSISSSTSSESSSPSGPDTPLSTPPSASASLPASKIIRPDSGFSLFADHLVDGASSTVGLHLQLESAERIFHLLP